MATAGRVTVAEVEEIVPAGSLDPDHIHTPGIYVDRVIQGPFYHKRIEFRTTRDRERDVACCRGHANSWRLRRPAYSSTGSPSILSSSYRPWSPPSFPP